MEGENGQWRKVRMSDELMYALSDRFDWGEPDEEGFYTPTVYRLRYQCCMEENDADAGLLDGGGSPPSPPTGEGA